jgi:hypothetical protein
MHHTKRPRDGLVNPWPVAALRRRGRLDGRGSREIVSDPVDFRLDKLYIPGFFQFVTSLRFRTPEAVGRLTGQRFRGETKRNKKL